MDLINQKSAIASLDELCRADSHAILIDGAQGSGKTYLSRYFAKKHNIEGFLEVEPKMDALREAVETCYSVTNTVALCIENLDLGVVGASYFILKFLEEPPAHVYLIVTCRNIRQIPDTILSRTIRVSLSPIVDTDLLAYVQKSDSRNKALVEKKFIPCIKNFADADLLLGLEEDKLNYLTSMLGFITNKDPVSTMVWKLQKYPDSTPTPLNIVVRYMMSAHKEWRPQCISCLDDMEYTKIPDHAALGKLIMNIKYGGLIK